MGEFELINKYFTRLGVSKIKGPCSTDWVGIGDDCAFISIPQGTQLAQSVDTMVEGVHFPTNSDPFGLGYRALACALSDLAAVGATPHSFTLALTLPEADEQWLDGFTGGLRQLAVKHCCPLVGGDTTKGPLTISVQVQGLVPSGDCLLRSGASPGDLICVTGTLGDAAGAIPLVLAGETAASCRDSRSKFLLHRYWYPSPRIEAGEWLRINGATSAVDVSDGLLGDLQHILTASRVGAIIDPNLLPRSASLIQQYGNEKSLSYAMTGGDDYELCFTVPEAVANKLPQFMPDGCRITCIGQITPEQGIIRNPDGNELDVNSYQHF